MRNGGLFSWINRPKSFFKFVKRDLILTCDVMLQSDFYAVRIPRNNEH